MARAWITWTVVPLLALASVTPPASAEGGGSPAAGEAPGRVIVQFDPLAGAADARAEALVEALPEQARRGTDRVEELGRFDLAIVDDVTPEALAALEAWPGVARVVPDVQLTPALDEVGQRTAAATLHARGVQGAGSIAIIDTGVDGAHEALAGSVIAEACFSASAFGSEDGDCPDGSAKQIGPGAGAPCTGTPSACTHGTHVGATAAGAATASSAPGVAPGADIVAVQVFDQHGAGAYLSDILRALDWTLTHTDEHDLVAVNLSLGSDPVPGSCDDTSWGAVFAPVVDELAKAGVVTVAAAGNNGKNTPSDAATSFPACLSGVVSVAALGTTNVPASYTNLSSTVDLFAPGRVHAAVPGGYATMQGTSMAAPQVAGAVSLLRQVKPGLSVKATRAAMTETGPAVSTQLGSFPRLEVERAQRAPGRARDMTATHGDQRATVSWRSAPRSGGSRITAYQVVASPGGRTVTVGGSDRSATVTGLSNHQRYTFTVRAVNRVRSGVTTTSANLVVPKPRPPRHGFPDVSSSSYYEHPVRWLKAEDITTGYGTTGRYEPHQLVTRGQMAAFLHRTFDEPAVSTRHGFADVPSSAYYDRPVRWLVARDITTGYGDTGLYEPHLPVTRAQMAAFLWRAAGEPTGYPHHGFRDVPRRSYYDDAVRWLKAEDITTGYGTTGRYEPHQLVTRGQMAAFLHRLATTPTAWGSDVQIPLTVAF